MLGEQVNVNARDLGAQDTFVRAYEQCSAKLNTAILLRIGGIPTDNTGGTMNRKGYVNTAVKDV